MPRTSTINIGGDQAGNEQQHQIDQLKWLTDHISSLYRKELVQKPEKFSRHNSMENHIQEMEKYFDTVNVKDDLGKICLLLESLDQLTKDELLFEDEYDTNANSYQWHKQSLLKICPFKSNATLDLSDLYRFKQNGISFYDFFVQVKSRIIHSKAIQKCDRSKIAIDIFLHGLDDQTIAKAVEAQKPNSLEDAYSFVKSLRQKNDSKECFALQNSSNSNNVLTEMAEMRKQLSYLTQVVLSLKSAFRALNAPPPKKVHRGNFNQPQRGFAKPMRYNSNSRPITCFNCGRPGHSAQDCWSKTKNVRYIEQRDNNSVSQPTAYDTDNASVNSNPSFQDMEEPATVNATTSCSNNEWTLVTRRKDSKRQQTQSMHRKEKKYSQEIENDYQYIIGRRHKNSFGKSFLNSKPSISSNNSEQKPSSFSNKPIIDAKINQKTSKLFLDSGSEINICDENYLLNELRVPKCNISPAKRIIRCANGSTMTTTGVIRLDVGIGVNSRELNFIVAPRVCPNIILGIRGMKTLGVEINLQRSSVVVRGVEIPFIAKINPETMPTPKNMPGLQLGVGVQTQY